MNIPATTWHTVATRDTRLLKKQIDTVVGLPKEYVFLNYLRCHDDIGWGLDYDTLHEEGMEEIPHKKYLSEYFMGAAGSGNGRGRLYNDDPVTMDARFCATTASMCGLERAVYEQNDQMAREAISLDLTLHAFMFTLSGIPVIYSGDEIGQLNDYSYEKDPKKVADSRYLHRGAFNWTEAEKRKQKGTVQERIYESLRVLEQIRRKEKAFLSEADVRTADTGTKELLALERKYGGEELLGIFNFSERQHTMQSDREGQYVNLLTGEEVQIRNLQIPAFSFAWLKKPGSYKG